MDEVQMKHVVGLADTCELMAACFAFPTEELCSALSSGAFESDARSCLADAGAEADCIAEACAGLGAFQALSAEELFSAMKKGHSILFLAPGVKVPVWPYESAFRFVASGREGVPGLFRSPVTLNVEAMMKAAGVRAVNSRKEPADSIWNEFSYLSYLYGSAAQALYAEDDEKYAEWMDHAHSFITAHVTKWMPAFMDATKAEQGKHSFGDDYVSLAPLGSLATALLLKDAESEEA